MQYYNNYYLYTYKVNNVVDNMGTIDENWRWWWGGGLVVVMVDEVGLGYLFTCFRKLNMKG